MKKSFLNGGIIFLITLLLFCQHEGHAWGLNGHRIVGEIAEKYLTKKARKAVSAILGDESIAMSSNWADFIKSDKKYNRFYNWHFVNIEAGKSCEEIKDFLSSDTATDAYTRINFLIEGLKQGSLPDSLKKEYLKLLIHIVGDLHQPLHVGHYSDLGGNKIKLLWFHDSTNLHQVWDEKLINFQLLSYTEFVKAINHISRVQMEKWKSMSLTEWVCDSYSIAAEIYSYAESSKTRLDYSYNYKYLDILNEQLLKGGYHLAQILNNIFG